MHVGYELVYFFSICGLWDLLYNMVDGLAACLGFIQLKVETRISIHEQPVVYQSNSKVYESTMHLDSMMFTHVVIKSS